MKKKYLVQTSGMIVEKKNDFFSINATSEDEAKQLAVQEFKRQHVVVDKQIVFDVKHQKLFFLFFSLVLMGICTFLIFRTWYINHTAMSMSPSMLAIIYGIILYSSFIVRFKGVKNIFLSIPDIIACVFIVCILASMIQILLQSNEITFLWVFKISIDANSLIIIALLLSFFGIKIVSCICYIFIGILAISNINLFSQAMGNLWGMVYLLTAYIGIMMYIACDPVLEMIWPTLINAVSGTLNYAKRDFEIGKIELENISDEIKDKINN